MNNLLDNIKRFKLARQAVSPFSKVQDEIDDLIKMYGAIGAEDNALESAFNREWKRLSEEKRSELVKRLLALGLLPQEVGDALELFNGKVVNLIGKP